MIDLWPAEGQVSERRSDLGQPLPQPPVAAVAFVDPVPPGSLDERDDGEGQRQDPQTGRGR